MNPNDSSTSDEAQQRAEELRYQAQPEPGDKPDVDPDLDEVDEDEEDEDDDDEDEDDEDEDADDEDTDEESVEDETVP